MSSLMIGLARSVSLAIELLRPARALDGATRRRAGTAAAMGSPRSRVQEVSDAWLLDERLFDTLVACSLKW